MELLPDTIFEQRFLIVRRLGSGSFGTVYEAVDQLFKRMVAIKLLNTSLLRDGESVGRFLREAKILANLNSKHLVQLFSVSECHGQYYMVMELVRGKTLRTELLTHGCLSEKSALQVGMGVARALQVLAQHGVVHRDLKPDNIMLSENKVELVKVLDLGLASLLFGYHDAKLTPEGMVVGSLHYIAPEICLGNEYDIRGDFYALGCILYECLVGQPPFCGTDVKSVFIQHVSATPANPVELVPSICKETQMLIARLLQKEPHQRYHDPAELVAALEDALLRSDSNKSRENRPALPYPRHRNWTKLSLALAIPLCLILFLCIGKAWPKIQEFRSQSRLSDICSRMLVADRRDDLTDRVSTDGSPSLERSLLNILHSEDHCLSPYNIDLLLPVIQRLNMLGHKGEALVTCIACLEADQRQPVERSQLKHEQFKVQLFRELANLSNVALSDHSVEVILSAAEKAPANSLSPWGPYFQTLPSTPNADLVERSQLLAIRLYRLNSDYEKMAQCFVRASEVTPPRKAKYLRAAVECFKNSQTASDYSSTLWLYIDGLLKSGQKTQALKDLIAAHESWKSHASISTKRLANWNDYFRQALEQPSSADWPVRSEEQRVLDDAIRIMSRDCQSNEPEVSFCAHYNLGILLTLKKKDGSAQFEKACHVVLQNHLKSEIADHIRKKYIIYLASHGRWDEVLPLLSGLDSFRFDALCVIINYYDNHKQFKQAKARTLEQASLLQSDPNSNEEKRLEWISEAFSFSAKDPDSNYDRQICETTRNFLGTFKQEEHRVAAMLTYSDFLLRKKRFPEAARLLAKASKSIQTTPSKATLWIALSNELAARVSDKTFENMLATIGPALIPKLNSTDERIEAHRRLADCFARSGNCAGAREQLTEEGLLLRLPNKAPPWMVESWVCMSTDLGRAIPDSEFARNYVRCAPEAISSDSDAVSRTRCLIRFSGYLVATGSYNEAVKWLMQSGKAIQSQVALSGADVAEWIVNTGDDLWRTHDPILEKQYLDIALKYMPRMAAGHVRTDLQMRVVPFLFQSNMYADEKKFLMESGNLIARTNSEALLYCPSWVQAAVQLNSKLRDSELAQLQNFMISTSTRRFESATKTGTVKQRINALNCLASLKYQTQQTDSAIDLYKQAWLLGQKSLHTPLDRYSTEANYASVLSSVGRKGEALTVLQSWIVPHLSELPKPEQEYMSLVVKTCRQASQPNSVTD